MKKLNPEAFIEFPLKELAERVNEIIDVLEGPVKKEGLIEDIIEFVGFQSPANTDLFREFLKTKLK